MPYHHFTESHRRLIDDLHKAGHSNRAIGRLRGRCHTTIGRELERNSHHGVYDSQTAQPQAEHRQHQPRRLRRLEHPELHQAVIEMLDRGWSPEIISAQWRQQHPDDPSWHLSHESIYQWIYREAGPHRPGAFQLGPGLTLPHGHTR